MSDESTPVPAPPPSEGAAFDGVDGRPAFGAYVAPQPATRPRERVLLGLLAAVAVVLLGMALTVVVWRAGYLAGITSFVMAIGAAFAYTKVAGSEPRRGLVPLILLIVVGVAASFFAIVASDLWDVYSVLAPRAVDPPSRLGFIGSHLFEKHTLSLYSGKDIGFFALFGVLGIFSTVRRMAGTR